MTDELKEEIKEEKPKGPLGRLKDKILPDEDEQAAIISTFVRLGVLVWSGGILTLNYVAIPGGPQQNIIGNGNGSNGGPPPVTAKDIEAIIAKAPAGPVQTIRIEQAPLKITTDDKPYKL